MSFENPHASTHQCLDEDACRAFTSSETYDQIREGYRRLIELRIANHSEFRKEVARTARQYDVNLSYVRNLRTFQRFSSHLEENTLRRSPVSLVLILLTFRRMQQP